ncbi:cytochrome P450 [Lentzea sp. NPDC051213]|uniref:cytochrome P450 n=1 Tax=Lentzea sp. NPDC051213 TaxID=3364126 RepID=UPI0037947EDF
MSGRVVRVTQPDGLLVWMVRGYDSVRALLNDPSLSSDTRAAGSKGLLSDLPPDLREVLALDLFSNDPPTHTELRRLLTPAFTAHQARELRPMMREVAHELLDACEGRPVVDLVADYADRLPTAVLCTLIGIPREDGPMIRHWADTFVSQPVEPGGVRPQMITALITYARALVKRRRAGQDSGDLLSRLLRSGLDDDHIVALVLDLVIAGQTAPAQLIAKSMRLLLASPAQLALVRADPSLLPGAIDECLRLDPPLKISIFRRATRPLMVEGVHIQAGEIVSFSFQDANRDDTCFADPERFDVRRTDNQHLGFGYGIHRCVGANLGKVATETAIEVLLERFPVIELVGSPEDLPWKETAIMHKLVALPLRLARRPVTATR